jgi:hypothetical protein
MNLPVSDLIWGIVGFALSIMIFSYLIGDNPLFRFAVHIFIGVSAGVVAVIVIYQVLYPRLVLPFINGTSEQKLVTFFPLVLSILLLFKVSPRLGKVGHIPSAYLLGVGVAVTIGGTVLGTIFPQSLSTIESFGKQFSASEKLEGVLILIATISTLLYFYFGANLEMGKPLKRPAWIEWSAKVGQVFILITLGAIFAGVYVTSISALSERLTTFWDLLSNLIK